MRSNASAAADHFDDVGGAAECCRHGHGGVGDDTVDKYAVVVERHSARRHCRTEVGDNALAYALLIVTVMHTQ